MTGRTTVGIDPGGTFCGIVARQGGRLLYGCTVTRDGTWPDYLAEVVATVHRAGDLAEGGAVVAVEDIVEPTGHLGQLNLAGLLGTARVVGALELAFPEAILVRPGGHGRGPLRCYPTQLVGRLEVAGTGKRRHCRSAWDIAGAVMRTTHTRTPTTDHQGATT